MLVGRADPFRFSRSRPQTLQKIFFDVKNHYFFNLFSFLFFVTMPARCNNVYHFELAVRCASLQAPLAWNWLRRNAVVLLMAPDLLITRRTQIGEIIHGTG